MLGFFKNIFNFNEQQLAKLKEQVAEINALEDKARILKDEEFKTETNKLKEDVQSGKKSLDEVLPWAYSLVREASRRVHNERHFDEQLMAGIALHQGKVAEQKTGEGKTLSATAPLYLNALEGKGVHLVTVNDYLARRDAGWMGEVFDFLGMTTAAMISEKSYIYDKDYFDNSAIDYRLIHLREISRAQAYQADVTYGINSEFGFDYLRDNMVYKVEDVRQREFNFAIIDEVDSVLIDEARTPHIISAPYDEDTSKYFKFAQMVKKLSEDDYSIDEKTRTVHLNEKGIVTIEKMLGITNVYEKDFDTLYYVEAALKARALFRNDKDYIVKDGEVVIVDEFTGRLLTGRRFSEGLHQAIEAKEGVEIKQESRTLATVSLQNYFRAYKKLAGMTGTAVTEAEEFHKIYKLDVIVVPTHRNIQRTDQPDKIFKTENGKYLAVVESIVDSYKTGRPVLVGTTSIEKNEILSSLLKKRGIPHELLNAKNHLQEASIISNAGKKGSITVATNMAGRGVDIILGGAPPDKYERKIDATDTEKEKFKRDYEKSKQEWQVAHDELVSLGGLYVIGTERHESRRIDNQLRGRSGRQGDPGETRFFVSLSDDMMRIFGGDQVAKLMTFFNIPEDQPLESPMVNKVLEQAQVKVEGFNFDMRKHTVEYDDVINKQREIIYKLRKSALYSGDISRYQELKKTLLDNFFEQTQSLVNTFIFLNENPDFENLALEYCQVVPFSKEEIIANVSKLNKDDILDYLNKQVEYFFDFREKQFGLELWVDFVKSMTLSTIDKYWTEHLTAIDILSEGVRLRAYGQLDPLVEYKNEAFTMFEALYQNINYDLSRKLLRFEIQKQQPEKVIDEKKLILKSASSGKAYNSEEKNEPVQNVAKPKLGRNDPCWCGSGKKYKKCHYPN